MKTKKLTLDPTDPDRGYIMQAAGALLAGQLVAFPTETVYGLGANALNPEAIKRIYTAKRRPANNPLIVHIATLNQLKNVAVDIPMIAYELAAVFWPGPLTLVLKRHPILPPSVSLGRDTVAVRVPSHPIAQALIETARLPVVAPSANSFTRPSATTADHVLADLDGRIDIVLDGGATDIGLESTVLDLTGDTPLILRPGGIPQEMLEPIIPSVQRYQQPVAMDDENARPAAPGMFSKHYAPHAEVMLFAGDNEAVMQAMQQAAAERYAAGQKVGLLLPEDELSAFPDSYHHVALGSMNDLMQAARYLFAALRQLDAQNVNVIITHLLPAIGLAVTINDRLLRAAEGRVIEITS